MMKLLCTFAITALLTGCGQSGDLFLPPEPSTEVPTETPNNDDDIPAGDEEDDEKTPAS